MPCGSPWDDVGSLSREVATLNGRIADLTRLLCKACRLLVRHQVDLPGSLERWWEAHQEEDQKRRLLASAEYTARRNQAKREIARLKKKYQL